MFINFLKLFEYLDFLYELLLEISKKKTSFRGLYYYIFTVDLTNSTNMSIIYYDLFWLFACKRSSFNSGK